MGDIMSKYNTMEWNDKEMKVEKIADRAKKFPDSEYAKAILDTCVDLKARISHLNSESTEGKMNAIDAVINKLELHIKQLESGVIKRKDQNKTPPNELSSDGLSSDNESNVGHKR